MAMFYLRFVVRNVRWNKAAFGSRAPLRAS